MPKESAKLGVYSRGWLAIAVLGLALVGGCRKVAPAAPADPVAPAVHAQPPAALAPGHDAAPAQVAAPALAQAPTPAAEPAAVTAAAPAISDEWAIDTACNNPESKAMRQRLASKDFASARIVLTVAGGPGHPARSVTILGSGTVEAGEVSAFGSFGGAPAHQAPFVPQTRLQRRIMCLVVRLAQSGLFAERASDPPQGRVVRFDVPKHERLVTVALGGESASTGEAYHWIWAEQILVDAGLKKCAQTFGCNYEGTCRLRNGTCVAGSVADCRNSSRCDNELRCALQDGQCVRDANSCRFGSDCRIHGNCTAQGEQCIAASNRDCRASDRCETEGLCVAQAGKCVEAKAKN